LWSIDKHPPGNATFVSRSCSIRLRLPTQHRAADLLQQIHEKKEAANTS
jgi:hypothetical protein